MHEDAFGFGRGTWEVRMSQAHPTLAARGGAPPRLGGALGLAGALSGHALLVMSDADVGGSATGRVPAYRGRGT